MGDDYDLVIIGFGSGGMTAAEFAATLDLRVAVVERSRVGRRLPVDRVRAVEGAAGVGQGGPHDAPRRPLRPRPRSSPRSTRPKVWSPDPRRSSSEIADADDNAERFEAMGVDVVFGDATASPEPNEVTVDGDRRRLRGARVSCCAPAAGRSSRDRRARGGRLPDQRDVFELDGAPASRS